MCTRLNNPIPLLLSFHFLPQLRDFSSQSIDLFLLLYLYSLQRINILSLLLSGLPADMLILLLDPFLVSFELVTLILDGCQLLGVVASSIGAGRLLWSHLEWLQSNYI